jgi:hypothetical protein
MVFPHWPQRILVCHEVASFFLYRKEGTALWCASVLVGKNLNVPLSLLLLSGVHKGGDSSKAIRPCVWSSPAPVLC